MPLFKISHKKLHDWYLFQQNLCKQFQSAAKAMKAVSLIFVLKSQNALAIVNQCV